jgi:hypothetical protein
VGETGLFGILNQGVDAVAEGKQTAVDIAALVPSETVIRVDLL